MRIAEEQYTSTYLKELIVFTLQLVQLGMEWMDCLEMRLYTRDVKENLHLQKKMEYIADGQLLFTLLKMEIWIQSM